MPIASLFGHYLWPLPPPRSLPPEGTITSLENPLYNFSVDYPIKWSGDIYEDAGFKGAKDLKLRIYKNSLFGQSMFRIAVYYQPATSPSLEDVEEWGAFKFASSNHSLREHGEEEYKEIDLSEDEINGFRILRRRYGNNEVTREDVYIARRNDMVIIRYQNFTDDFENMYDEANGVIESFQPLE